MREKEAFKKTVLIQLIFPSRVRPLHAGNFLKAQLKKGRENKKFSCIFSSNNFFAEL